MVTLDCAAAAPDISASAAKPAKALRIDFFSMELSLDEFAVTIRQHAEAA
jgi:hypothetical protein